MVEASSPGAGNSNSRFVTGSTLKHVVIMTAASAAGLTAIFLVDLLNVFYIILLNDETALAALGFASTLLLFQISIGIGLTIGTSVYISRALGAGNKEKASEYAFAGLVVSTLLGLIIVLISTPFIPSFLDNLGALGETASRAERYLYFVFPTMPFLAFGMVCSGILRGIGDAKASMWVTLSGGIATAIADPILILGFDLGLDGAALAAMLSRVAFIGFGIYGVIFKHKLFTITSFQTLLTRGGKILGLSAPIVLTNVATAAGSYFLTQYVAVYGDVANAAYTTIGRLIPFGFGFLFALSGAVGPVIGQNLGAGQYGRMRRAYLDGIIVGCGYALVVTIVFFLLSTQIPRLMGQPGDVSEIVTYFLRYAAWPYIFFGMLIVSNAVFNTIGKPHYATLFNWSRATLGVIPFCIWGAQWGRAEEVLLFHSFGFIPFGIAAALIAYVMIDRIAKNPDDFKPKGD